MPGAETISSAANPLIKDVRRAISRSGLTAQGWCIAETFHLLEEALRSDCDVYAVLAAESVWSAVKACVRPETKVVILPNALFQSISDTETSQGVMALVKPPTWTLDQFPSPALIVVLDGIQDPGNAGTIMRAAEAFGATGVVFVKGTVSPHNPKTLRASAGSLFRIPFVHSVDPAPLLATLQQKGVQLYAAVPATVNYSARHLDQANLTAGCALIIGNEARGVSETLRASATDLSIPTVGVDSLNAAVAAGILLYEARRQRTLRS